MAFLIPCINMKKNHKSIAAQLQMNYWLQIIGTKYRLKLKNRAIYERQLIEADICKQMGEMAEFNKQYDYNQKAMVWWKNLTLSQRISYEYQTFGDGDAMEDNTLHEKDIVLMFNKYNDENL